MCGQFMTKLMVTKVMVDQGSWERKMKMQNYELQGKKSLRIKIRNASLCQKAE